MFVTKICIVRHGQSEWNAKGLMQGRRDIELNEVGLRQADKVAQYLISDKWDVIVSSPLKRATKTAEIISKVIGIEKVYEVEDLQERDWGGATGLTHKELDEKDGGVEILGIESWEDLKIRGIKAFQSIVKKYPNKNIIVVSHGAIIRAILEKIAGKDMVIERLKNTSMTIINYDNNKWTIELLNYSINEDDKVVNE